MYLKVISSLAMLSILVLTSDRVVAQQLNQISMTPYHPYKDYSAYAGFDRSINITALTRNQWSGHPGYPKTRYLGVHLPYYILKAGFGFDLQNNSEGNIVINTARASANRVFDMPFGILSIGGRISLNNVSIGTKDLTTPNGEYIQGTINHNDPLLLENLKGINLGWEISSWWRYNNLQLGASFQNLPQPFFNSTRSGNKLDKNVTFFTSAYFDIQEKIQIQPFIHIKTNILEVQTEIGTTSRINGNIFGGIVLRGYHSKSIDALGLHIGHRLNKRYSLYYNYDAGLSKLRYSNDGTHEIIMRMELFNLPGTGLPQKIIYNPRYTD